MTHTEFIFDPDYDFAGRWNEEEDKIVLNGTRLNSILEIIDVLIHEDLHAGIGWAMSPKSTTADEDHYIIRAVSFE